MNQLIVASLKKAASGKLPGIPTKPNYCLQFVRVVIEDALKLPSHDFYRRHLVDGTTRRGDDPQRRLAEARADPWASDLERSMKLQGLAVPALLRRGGDLVFDHRAAEPIGHVGILLDRNWVVESIHPANRPTSINLPNFVSITPYSARPWTLVARLQPDKGVVPG
ncbi:MAG: hypothetical protein M0R28_21565 [Pigmentiphaga sp.]|nr:hypothetical protein [Pigmentiphaga sp.]